MDLDKEKSKEAEEKNVQSRRTVLKALAGIPVLGYFAYELLEHNSFYRKNSSKLINDLGLQDIKAPSQISGAAKGDLLRIGFIGFGNRAEQLASGLGFLHPDEIKSKRPNGGLNDWLAQENLNVAITGVCDVFDLNAEKGMAIAGCDVVPGGGKPLGLPVKRYRTYQEMLDDKSIDAVFVATPDHHHARISADAIKAGKHVYCEKSVALSEDELHEVYNAVKSSDRVFQLGHQITQNAVFQQAKEIVKRGILGPISLIQTSVNRNTAEGAWIRHLDKNGNPKPGSLKTIDWDQWLGDRPKKPFSIDRFYNWTKFFDYDTGMLGQLFSHEYDAVNQLLRIGIPHSAVSSGGIYYWKDNRDMADTLQSVWEYPDKNLTLLFSATLSSSYERKRTFMGHDASMQLEDSLSITADYDSTKYKQKIENGTIDTNSPMITINSGSTNIDAVSTATEKYYASRGLTSTYINGRAVDVTYLHIREWINCIRNGGVPSANIERAFEEGVTILMAQKSYVEKRRVEWARFNEKSFNFLNSFHRDL